MNILVSGASGQIGKFLLPKLILQGHQCLCVSRDGHDDVDGIGWIKCDMNMDMSNVWHSCDASVWIHLGFLPLAVSHLEAAFEAGIRRFVAFSSTSVFTKEASESHVEQQTIERLMDAEKSMVSMCQSYGIDWTLFRPTMIYGCGMDQNVAFIQKIIARFGFFPVAGQAGGLRQPVHADDLAQAVLSVCMQQEAFHCAYNLSGAETLTYKAMVERIFLALHKKPRIIHIHPTVYKCGITILKRIMPRYAFVHTSMVDRMAMDMVFDHTAASQDFAYHPRVFQP